MVPKARLRKADGKTGVVRPSSSGVCAIIAPCEKGTANQPASYARDDLAVTDFGNGILTGAASYMIPIAQNPVVLIRGTATTAGVYSAITTTGGGTSVVTAGASAPQDDYDSVIVTFITGGTIGVAGITYTESLDGGTNTSAKKALGTASTLTIPNSGVSLALAAGTILAGQTATFKTTGPRMTNSDITTALEALRTSSLRWEALLVLGHDADATTITTIDAWLLAREAEGRFRFFMANARGRNAGESEAAYLTAMDTAFSASASIRGIVAVDGGDLASATPGRTVIQKRPTSLAIAARLMDIAIGRDAAYVADGPVPGYSIADERANPKYHDELFFPGHDDIRLAALRSFDGRNGVFINNATVISPFGSDYVWAQHVRTMNRACEIAYDVMTAQLSAGINKNPKPGPAGEIYIAEESAREIDALVNQSLTELLGQVNDILFTLSRTDNIGANGPITLTGALNLVALAYVKGFDVTAAFARSITVKN
jgi:hypothetical protein